MARPSPASIWRSAWRWNGIFRCLLVDSDVAKQHITDIFGFETARVCWMRLTDESLDPESLIVPTSTRGFSILPAGRRVEGTAELMSSNRMRQIVDESVRAKSAADLLLDSPPLLITNEGRAIVKIAGQVVLVVRAGETPRHAVQAAIGMFDEKQAGRYYLNQVKVGLTEGYYGYGAYGTSERCALGAAPTAIRSQSQSLDTVVGVDRHGQASVMTSMTQALAIQPTPLVRRSLPANLSLYGVDVGIGETDNVTLVQTDKVSQTIAITDADFDSQATKPAL